MPLKFIIDKEYDRQFIGMSTKVTQKNFDEIFDESLPYLQYTQKAYQKAWNEIDKDFFDYLYRVTGHQFYKNYFCVISITCDGISNWGYEPKILRGWKENPYTQRRITAHEIILSHYFEIYRRCYSEHGLSDNQVWALAEIAALALTSLTEESKRFWPWDFSGYYTDHNYPQIVDLQKKLKHTFLKRKNFDQYMVAGIKLVKKFGDIRL